MTQIRETGERALTETQRERSTPTQFAFRTRAVNNNHRSVFTNTAGPGAHLRPSPPHSPSPSRRLGRGQPRSPRSPPVPGPGSAAAPGSGPRPRDVKGTSRPCDGRRRCRGCRPRAGRGGAEAAMRRGRP